MTAKTSANKPVHRLPEARGGYTIRGAVEWSGLSRSALYRAAADGKLVLRKMGRTTIVDGPSLALLMSNLPVAEIRKHAA